MNDHSGLRVVEERSRLPTDALRALSQRLDGPQKSVDLGEGWERGVPGGWLDALLGDWRVFDTDALQRRLDALRQQRAEVRGHVVHLVHAEGRGPSPMPLLLTHADAFTVVVPSLPGYGFSGPPPPTGMTGREVARLWYELMSVGLGYERFVAHGSDLGAGVTAWLARDQPGAVAAIHLATPGWPLHLGRGQRTRRTSRAPSRTGPRRRAATCTSTPPSRHARGGPVRQSRRTGSVDWREDRRVEQHSPGWQPGV